ncbi:glycosyltransferase, partial [Bacteroides cellulosilyticus]
MVAVIMSIYKNDKLMYVAKCVDSLLKQTFEDFHVYIQYDGVVEDDIEHFFMELNDSRFHVYSRDENYGLAYSLNELLTIILTKNYDYI